MANTRSAPVVARPSSNGQRPSATPDLRSLALQVFEAIGALVDPRADGTFDVLVPEAYQDLLQGEGFLRLTSDPAVAARSSATLLAIGSPIVDQLVTLADRFGRTTRWYVEGLRWSRRQAVNLDRWGATFVNARLRGDGVEQAFASHHLLLNFRVSFLSDEKREELHTVVLDARTRQPSALLERLWEHRPPPDHGRVAVAEALRPAGVTWPEPIVLAVHPSGHLAEADQLPDRTALTELRQHAQTLLERRLADSLAGHRRRAAHQLELERARIDAFFDDTEAELRRRLARTEDPVRQQGIQEKIAAAQLDRERKYADVAAKHTLRVTVKLLNAALITQPKVRTLVTIENRYASAPLTVVYDPLTGEVELPTCQECFAPARAVHLAANGLVLCDACAIACSYCKREYRERDLARCVVCQRPLCPQHQGPGASDGTVTCPDDRGRDRAPGAAAAAAAQDAGG